MEIYIWVTVIVCTLAVIAGWFSWRERNKRWKEHIAWRDSRVKDLEAALEKELEREGSHDADDLYAAIEILLSDDPLGPYTQRWIEGLP